MTKYKYYVKSKYIVFIGGGDCYNQDIGDLIIRLVLPDDYEWSEDKIIYNKNITLYQYVYGIELDIKIGDKKIQYDNWNASRDGNIININEKFVIKLILNYNHDDNKKNILLKNFN